MTDSQAHQAIIRVADSQVKQILIFTDEAADRLDLLQAYDSLIKNLALAPNEPARLKNAKTLLAYINKKLKHLRRPQLKLAL